MISIDEAGDNYPSEINLSVRTQTKLCTVAFDKMD